MKARFERETEGNSEMAYLVVKNIVLYALNVLHVRFSFFCTFRSRSTRNDLFSCYVGDVST